VNKPKCILVADSTR